MERFGHQQFRVEPGIIDSLRAQAFSNLATKRTNQSHAKAASLSA
jgi:hypothetical protein